MSETISTREVTFTSEPSPKIPMLSEVSAPITTSGGFIRILTNGLTRTQNTKWLAENYSYLPAAR